MRIPGFIKAMIGCTDPHSCRYALGAVKFENANGVSHAIATDGRVLVDASWGERLDADVDVMLAGDTLKKAATAAAKKGKDTIFEVVTPEHAMVKGGGGTGLASIVSSGRYPRWRDVFPADDCSKRFTITLCPDLMASLMAVYSQAGAASVQFWFDDAQSAVLMAARGAGGEVIRSVLMPKSNEDASSTYPDAAEPAPVREPETATV